VLITEVPNQSVTGPSLLVLNIRVSCEVNKVGRILDSDLAGQLAEQHHTFNCMSQATLLPS
jgi:hypothetical protein